MDDKKETVVAAQKLLSMTRIIERCAASENGIGLGEALAWVGDEISFQAILRTLSDCKRATVKNGRLVAIR